jgi:hypothetical protein
VIAAIAALAAGAGVVAVGVLIANDDPENTPEPTVTVGDDLTTNTAPSSVDDGPDASTVPTSTVADDPALDVESTTTSSTLDGATTSTTADTTSSSAESEGPASDGDGVRCVDTIAVVYADGASADFVVLEQPDSSSFLVLDVDGTFVISSSDSNIDEVVAVARDVRFFEGAAIEFGDVCTDLGGDEGVLDEAVASMRSPGQLTTLSDMNGPR